MGVDRRSLYPLDELGDDELVQLITNPSGGTDAGTGTGTGTGAAAANAPPVTGVDSSYRLSYGARFSLVCARVYACVRVRMCLCVYVMCVCTFE